MIKPFDFYFDFASPYTFLAHKEIVKVEKENLIKIKYMPVLLGALLKTTGSKANADIPIKAKYMIKDCKLWAEKKNVSFKFNSNFPIISLNLMRSVLLAEKKGFSQKLINKIFDSIWIENLNLNETEVFEKLLTELGINAKIFLADLTDPVIKDDLKKRTSEALSKGIFGLPSFVINNKIFWGQDRLEFALIEAKK
jgi:2-hydroxychromene-2-carboxylate isomerase